MQRFLRNSVFTAVLATLAVSLPQIVKADTERAELENRLASVRSDLQAIARSGNPETYNARSSPRIVNGRPVSDDVDRGTWESAASLHHSSGQQFCGGVLVAPNLDVIADGAPGEKFVKSWLAGHDDIRMILTAAHCFFDRNGNRLDKNAAFLSEVSILSGVTNVTLPNVRQAIQEVILHPNYDNRTKAHDIAIVLLKAPNPAAPPSATPRSVKLPFVQDVLFYTQTTAAHTVLGWGRTASGGGASRTLLSVNVPFSDQDVCRERYASLGGNIHSSSFCAGFITGGFDSCQGDSGGGIFYRPTIGEGSSVLGRPILSGIVSWGEGCGWPGFPGVYADVLQHVKWINTTVAKHATHFE